MAFGAFASSGPDLSGAAPRRRSYIAIILLAPGVLYLVATFIAPVFIPLFFVLVARRRKATHAAPAAASTTGEHA